MKAIGVQMLATCISMTFFFPICLFYTTMCMRSITWILVVKCLYFYLLNGSKLFIVLLFFTSKMTEIYCGMILGIWKLQILGWASYWKLQILLKKTDLWPKILLVWHLLFIYFLYLCFLLYCYLRVDMFEIMV